MSTILRGLEYIVSKLGHPNLAISVSNKIIDNQKISGYKKASIGRNCTLRGNVDLGEGVVIPNGCELRNNVQIGKWTKIGADCDIIGDVKIGKFCAIARDVTFQQFNHPIDRPSMNQTFYDNYLDSKLHHISSGPITVGNDVWIGTKVIVLSGVTIGDGAVIGAGSVVTDDVEPYSIVAGTPAERIKWRFPEEIREKLQDIAWWEWDDEKILENKDFFHTPIESVSDLENSLEE